MDEWGTFFIKVMVLIAVSPAWFPFLKAVWEDMNESMAEEGGMFGPTPSRLELEKIKREKALRPDPMVHEPWMTRERQQAGRRQMRTRSSDNSPAAAGPTARRRSF